MKDYIRRFFKDEDSGTEGAEFLEVAVILALAAALIIVITVIYIVVNNKAVDAGEALDNTNNQRTNVNWEQYRDDPNIQGGNTENTNNDEQ